MEQMVICLKAIFYDTTEQSLTLSKTFQTQQNKLVRYTPLPPPPPQPLVVDETGLKCLLAVSEVFTESLRISQSRGVKSICRYRGKDTELTSTST